MDKVFKLRITEDGLGQYNSLRISNIYVVAPSSDIAVKSVLTVRTTSIEVVSSYPVLIVNV